MRRIDLHGRLNCCLQTDRFPLPAALHSVTHRGRFRRLSGFLGASSIHPHLLPLLLYCCCFCFWSRVISRANQAAHPLHAPLMSIRLCKYLLGASYSSSISPTAPRFPLLLLNSSYSFSVFATVPQCLTFPPLFSNCSSTLLVHINSSPTHQMNSHWFLHLLNASAFFPVPPIPLSTLPLSFATSIPLITLQYLSFLFNFYNKIHHSKKSCFPDTQQVDRKLTCSRKTIF